MNLSKFTPVRVLAAVMTALVLGGCTLGSRSTDRPAEMGAMASQFCQLSERT